MSGAPRGVFSDLEEEFFRAGESSSEQDSWADLDEDYRPIGLWERLRGRGPKRPATVPPIPPMPSVTSARAPAYDDEDEDEDEEWQWQIAIARARADAV